MHLVTLFTIKLYVPINIFNWVSDHISFKLLVGEIIITVLFVYALHLGLEKCTTNAFYDDLQSVMSNVKDQEFLKPCGDWNNHTGQVVDGFQGVHGGLA